MNFVNKILTLLFILLTITGYSQETTIEVLDIVSKPVDTIYCESDTITTLYLMIQKTSTDNGTNYPNISVDTILYQNGVCPADSLEVLRQLSRDAIEVQNRRSRAAELAFEARRQNATFNSIRTIYNNFTNSDLYLAIEDRFFSTWKGRYRIMDIEAGTSVFADLVRLGPSQRYRLEVDSQTRYAVIPNNSKSFRINYNSVVYEMTLDPGVDSRNPVFRDEGFLSGNPKIVIVKVR